MSNDLQVRFATPSDTDVIAEFNRAMAWETERKRLDADTVSSGIRRLLSQPEAGFYLVALADDQPVGCLMITFEWSDWRDGQFWWIQSVYVKSTHRRRGVFRRLYQAVTDMAVERPDVCGIRLYVERDNRTAQRTYSQLGMNQAPYLVYETEFDAPAS